MSCTQERVKGGPRTPKVTFGCWVWVRLSLCDGQLHTEFGMYTSAIRTQKHRPDSTRSPKRGHEKPADARSQPRRPSARLILRRPSCKVEGVCTGPAMRIWEARSPKSGATQIEQGTSPKRGLHSQIPWPGLSRHRGPHPGRTRTGRRIARQGAKRYRKAQSRTYGAYMAFLCAVVRWGEAQHSRPHDEPLLWALRKGFQNPNPMDGHCLVPAFGFVVLRDALQVRTQMARMKQSTLPSVLAPPAFFWWRLALPQVSHNRTWIAGWTW